MASDDHLLAYGDESFRQTVGGVGFYVVAASVVYPDDRDDARLALRSLQTHKHVKLHWRDLDDRQREKAARVVGELGATHVAIIGHPLDAKRQERARRLCLIQALADLEALDVDELVLEERPATLNKRDIDTVVAARAQRRIGGITVAHTIASAEPLLWSADIVAGAITTALTGNTRYKRILNDATIETEVRFLPDMRETRIRVCPRGSWSHFRAPRGTRLHVHGRPTLVRMSITYSATWMVTYSRSWLSSRDAMWWFACPGG